MRFLLRFRSDADLVRTALDEGARAAEALVLRYQKKAYAIARAAGVRADAADDVVQEAFLRTFRHLSSLRDPATFGPWFLAIVRNVAKSHLRSRDTATTVASQEEPVRGAAIEPPVEEALEERDFGEHLWGKVGELPESLREAIFLYYYEGRSIRSVADALGLTVSAAKDRLRRGRELLRERLWREMRSELRDMLPSTRTWQRTGRRLTLVVLASLAPSWTRAAGAIVTSLSSLATPPFIPIKPILGVILMSGKKIAISLTLAILILVGGIAYFSIRTGGGGGQAGPPAASPAASTPVLAKKARLGSEPAGSTEAKSGAPNAVWPASIAGRIVSEGRGLEGARILAVNTASWQAIIDGVERDSANPWDPEAKLECLRGGLLGMAKTVPATSSEANGSFRFPSLTAGTYRLLAAREGFLPSTGNLVKVVPGTTARVEIELVPALSIAGKVVDPSGAPIPGAVVEAESRERAALLGSEKIDRQKDDLIEGKILVEASPASSASDGSFRLDSLEPTFHDLIARKEGFLVGRAYQVAAGSRDVVLILQPGRSVFGRVLGPDRSPVTGAEVKLSPTGETEVHRLFSHGLFKLDASRRMAKARTGDDGRFRVAGFDPGSFVLLVGVEGLPPLEKEIAIAEADLDLGDLALEAPRTISGTVRDPEGNPFQGARVRVPKPSRKVRSANTLAAEEKEVLTEARSGSGGTFALGGLPAGSFEVRASAEGFADAVAKGIRSGTGDLSLILQAGLSIRGKVVDGETWEPVAGAEVRVGSEGELRVTTDAKGSFLVRGFPLAELHYGSTTFIRVQHPEYDPYDDSNAIVFGRDDRTPLVIPLSKGEKVLGRVSDAEGRPVAGARVWIESTGISKEAIEYDPARGIQAMTGADGSFVLAAPTGFRGMFGEIRFHVVASQPTVGRGRAGPFSVPGIGNAWPQVDLVLVGSTIEGKVTDEGGKPVPRARIAASPVPDPEDDRWPAGGKASGPSTYSGPDGSYRLAGVEAGPVVVVATSLGFAPRKIAGLVAGEDPLHLDIVLSRGGTVEGRVHGGGGEPITQAEVIALPEEMEEEPGPLGVTEFARRMSVLKTPGLLSARTGPDGGFRLEHLPEGTFAIAARAPGYEAAIVSSVKSGTSGIELVLERFSAVGGEAFASDTREPVARFTVDILDRRKLKAELEKYRAARRGGGPVRPYDYRVASEGELAFDHPAGLFLFDGLRPGEYTVLIRAEGFLNATRDVFLKGGEETSVEVPLDRGGRIDGIVLDKESGAPVAGAEIQNLWNDNEEEEIGMSWFRWFRTGADGTFSVSGLREGKCVLAIEHPYYLKEQAIAVELPRQEDKPLEIRLAPAGRLEGRIRGYKGFGRGKKSVSYSLDVRMLREDPANPGKRTPEEQGVPHRIGGDGRYSADNLRPGVYLIELKKQLTEIGDVVITGPSGGYIGYKKSAGPEERTLLGEVEIRPRETAVFEVSLPEEPDDTKAGG
jgi:RNA polymerase sigma-70 factor (ECF subfamily)